MQYWLMILGASMLVFSAVSLVLYAWDKRRAAKGGWRIPEKRLHLISLLGGWPGAMLAQKWFRHKTVKHRFRLWFWLTVWTHVVIACALAYAIWHWQHRV